MTYQQETSVNSMKRILSNSITLKINLNRGRSQPLHLGRRSFVWLNNQWIEDIDVRQMIIRLSVVLKSSQSKQRRVPVVP